MKKIPLFTIVYEDEQLVAVNKAAGPSVGRNPWNAGDERLEVLLESCYPQGLFITQRLDAQASGMVVFARSSESRTRLLPAFIENRAAKRFIAVVHGRPSWKQADCDLPLVPNGNKLHKTIIDKYRGKHAYTHFQVLTQAGTYTVLEAVSQTDWVHQIRVHLCAMGHPIVCDPLYGSLKAVYLSSFKHNWHGDPLEERPLLARLGLHALALTLPDVPPLVAPLAQDMKAVIAQIEKRSGQQSGVDLLACGTGTSIDSD